MTMARDGGWDIPLEFEGMMRPQPLENLGKSYMPIGFYRIDCQEIEGDTLYDQLTGSPEEREPV